MSSDESDEAPEDISFSTGKANAERDLDIAKTERKKQDNLSKEWKRKRDLLYKEQKERKKLALDVLIKAEEEFSKNRANMNKKRTFDGDDDDEDDDDDDGAGFPGANSSDEDSIDGEDKEELEEREDDHQSDMEEEKPTTDVKVLSAVDHTSLMQRALDFKAKALYGRKRRRVTASERQQQLKKALWHKRASNNAKHRKRARQ